MSPKSPREMMDAISRNLPDRTGKSLEQWANLVKAKGPKATKERVDWLRKKHGLGGPTATVIVAAAEGRDLTATYEDSDALVDAMYSGTKAALRPIHEAALKAAQALGKDVTASARKTYMTLSRKRQFAVIQPSTKTRVDIGFALSKVKATSRLKKTTTVGGGRITHSIACSKPSDVNAEVKKWLKAAYEQDA
jgi:hypothetical protein